MENNAVTKLLAFDRQEVERKTGTVMMPLSKLGGEVVTFDIQELSAEMACQVQDKLVTVDQATGQMSTHSYKPAVITIINGCPNVFKNNELRKHYECNTFEDLVGLLLSKGEIEKLSSEINKLSDINMDELNLSDDELKN